MRKILMFILSCASLVILSASQKKALTPQEIYISRFSSLAVEEMYRSGVPASITLAQGLLESRYGLSDLAVKGNNHFGIKCHNTWQGERMFHDDDLKGECFRSYDSPEESFRDHSDFLRYRDRYKFLFDLDITDYKSWAHGLKKAGYATDPAYPAKLIRLIEEYSLYEFDRPQKKDRGDRHLYKGTKNNTVEESSQIEETAEERPERSKKKQAKAQKQDRRKKKNEPMEEPVEEMVIPESPSRIEAVKVLDEGPKAEFRFPLSRQMYSMNGVPFVYSAKGETYSSIAKSFDLFKKEILKFNDLPVGTDLNAELAPGTLVYVQAKKNEAARGLEKHVMEADDNLRTISQRYGVKLEKIYKMNGFDATYVPHEGDIIKLRN